VVRSPKSEGKPQIQAYFHFHPYLDGILILIISDSVVENCGKLPVDFAAGLLRAIALAHALFLTPDFGLRTSDYPSRNFICSVPAAWLKYPPLDWSRVMKFEDAGRALDREFDKLRRFLNHEVTPQTHKEMAEFLRKSADRLTKMAERLENEEAKP